MAKNLFSSELYSNAGEKYKVDLYSESYSRLTWDIIGGSGNYFWIAGDWTPYFDLADPFILYDDDLPTSTTRSMSLFSYNAAEDRTEFRFTVGLYDSMWDRVALDINMDAFSPKIESIFTEWESEGDEILQAIKASNTTISYMNEGVEVDYLMNLMLEADDDEFKLIIYKDVSSSWELEWVGNIVPDLFEWQDSPKPYPITLRAIDGLNRLKNLRYDEAVTDKSERSLKNHIYNFLEMNNLSQFWGGGDPYLRESIDYHSNEVSGTLTTSHSPLDYSYLSDRLFFEWNENIQRQEGINVYDALKGILELFSCRIFISKGIYYIQQARNYSDNSIFYREFTKVMTTYTASSYTPEMVVGDKQRSDDLVSMEGGTFGHLAGLIRTSLPVNVHDQAEYEMLPLTTAGTNPATRSETFEVYGGVGSGTSIRFSFGVRENNNVRSGDYCYVKIEMTDGTNYFEGGNNRTVDRWTTIVSSKRYWDCTTQKIGKGNRVGYSFETDEIPFSGTMTVTLTITWYDYNGNTKTAAVGEGFAIASPKIQYPTGDSEVWLIEVENTNTKYTKELKLDQLIVSDLTNLTSLNTLSVKSDYLTTNTTLVESETWDGDFDTDDYLSATRVKEAMSLQYKPVRRYRGVMEGQYYPHQVINYDNATFFMNGFVKHYSMDENDGEWLQAINKRAGLTMTEFDGWRGHKEQEGDRNDGYAFVNMNKTHHNITTVSADKTAGTVTSLSVVASGLTGLVEDDSISIVNPINNDIIETFILSADMSDTDTTISVDSKVTTVDIKAGMIVQLGEKKAQNKLLMADKWYHETAQSVPTVLGDMRDGEMRIADGKIYIRDGSVINVTTVTEEIS